MLSHMRNVRLRKGKETCPRPHSFYRAELDLNLGFPMFGDSYSWYCLRIACLGNLFFDRLCLYRYLWWRKYFLELKKKILGSNKSRFLKNSILVTLSPIIENSVYFEQLRIMVTRLFSLCIQAIMCYDQLTQHISKDD